MKHPVAVMGAAGVFVIAVFLLIGVLFVESINQRHASCRATLVALEASRDTAAAGIRRVVPGLPPGTPPALVESFRRQQAQTLLSNMERRAVIAEVEVATRDLRRSSFCQ